MTEARRERTGWSVATQGLAVLAAGAGFGAAIEAEAGIVYTDVPDALIQNSSLGIDLNNDSTIDFTLTHASGPPFFVSLSSPSAANQVMGEPSVADGFPPKPFALSAGCAIPSGTFIEVDVTAGVLASNSTVPPLPLVHWFDGTNAYLGLKFDLPDGTHYGWAHLLVEANATNNRVTLFDYAYRCEPNVGLSAGETGDGCAAAVPLPPSVALLAAGAVTALALRRRGRDKD